MTRYRQHLEALCRRIRAQRDALTTLRAVFAQEADRLRRQDEAGILDALRAMVEKEVSYIRGLEAAAAYQFIKGTLISGMVKFALGSVIAAVVRSSEHPLVVGARWAEGDLARTAPARVVVIVVGPGGVPGDVHVVPLSRWARELQMSESDVKEALEARGYCLMAPETFELVLSDLRERVLKGMAALPVAASSLENSREGKL